MEPVYRYAAKYVRSRDGDTYEFEIDLGFEPITTRKAIRIVGFDARERHTPEGKAAKAYVEQLLPTAGSIVIETFKDKRGTAKRTIDRWLGDVWVDGVNIGDLLVAAGHADITVRVRK